MRLLDKARGMDGVVQDDERAEIARFGRGGNAHRRQQVGGAVRTGCIGTAHGAGDHHRPIAGDHKIKDEG